MDEESVNLSSKKKKVMCFIIMMVIFLLALIIGINIYNMSSNRVSRRLDLGQKYLKEQNYEQAIVEFDKAIAIDPMSVEAYLGKADAYIGLGDLTSAVDTLQTGFDLTGDERLKEKLDEAQLQLGQAKQAEDSEQELSTEKFDKDEASISELNQYGAVSFELREYFVEMEELSEPMKGIVQMLVDDIRSIDDVERVEEQANIEIIPWQYENDTQKWYDLLTIYNGYKVSFSYYLDTAIHEPGTVEQKIIQAEIRSENGKGYVIIYEQGLSWLEGHSLGHEKYFRSCNCLNWQWNGEAEMVYYFVDGDYIFAFKENGLMKNSVFTGELVRTDLEGFLVESNYGGPYVQFTYDEDGHQIRDDGSIDDSYSMTLSGGQNSLEYLYW